MTSSPVKVELCDSRRLTGATLLMDEPGAVIDVSLADGDTEAVIEAWRGSLRPLLDAIGWSSAELHVHRFAGGASLGFTAPIDALYAACEVNEWALAASAAQVADAASPSLSEAVERLSRTIAGERNPRLLALRDEARRQSVAFLCDDDSASVGLGTGSTTWPIGDLPHPDRVDWQAVHDVPVLLITGTNGKSTTVRLTARIVEAAGRMPGLSSTDWIRVGGEILDTGDYSGPGGARAVLRDPRTEVAVLETARGGLLRRGLGVVRADAAAVLNVAEDHLGEWGVGDLAGLVETKFLVAKAIDEHGFLILNADEPPVLERGRQVEKPRLWFGLDAACDEIAASPEACFLEDGTLFLARAGARRAVVEEADIPITYGGRARFNTSNALAATALASCAGIDVQAIATGLRAFDSTPEDNPGRGNRFDIDGVTVFADFAHNPHGTRALFDMARAFDAGRTLVLLGQAGDRTNADVRALVEATWTGRPDRIIVKDMPQHIRGRKPGEMVALIDAELERVGVPGDRIEHADSELEAVRRALEWSRPGDLLLLLLHAQRTEALELLQGAAHA